MLPDFRIFKEKLEIWMFTRNVLAFETLCVSHPTRLKADLTCGHQVQLPPETTIHYTLRIQGAQKWKDSSVVRTFKEGSNFKYLHLTFLKIF